MTIPFAQNPGGLFNRLGAIGQIVADIQALVGQGGTLATDLTALLSQYEGTGVSNAEPDLLDGIIGQANGSRIAATGINNSLANVAAQTIERMVFRDQPISSRTNILSNLAALIQQMKGNSQTVKRCTVTGSFAPVAGYSNIGTGTVVLSTKRGDGLTQENLFAETGRLICVSDAQGSASAGSESWQYLGSESQPNPWHYEWPLGSGASAGLQSCDAQRTSSAGNLLSNSAWATITSNAPAKWVDTLTLAGTDFFKETLNVFGTDTNALRFVGGTGHVPAITQQFGLSTGTVSTLTQGGQYAVNVAMACNNVPPSGSFVFELIDNNNNVLSDDQGIVNQFTVPCNTVTRSYTFFNAVFRLPRLLPSSVRFRVRVGVAIPAGGYQVFLAHLAMQPMTKLYAGGPAASVFSGAVPWISNDQFSVTFTNDRGGASSQKTFQTLFDRLFSMRQFELLLPSSLTPTISDTLI